MNCYDCHTSATGYCFIHIPRNEIKKIVGIDGQKAYKLLNDALKKMIEHEGTKWGKVPCPHDFYCCNYCKNKSGKHDQDCFLMNVKSLLESLPSV